MQRQITLLFLVFAFGHCAIGQSFASPEPYGGKDAVRWLIEQEQHYPEEALSLGLSGDVVLIFQVTASGELQNLRVQIPFEPACDAEAMRLVRMIRWYPASVGGTKLAKDQTITIRFDAKRYRKLHAKARACTDLDLKRPADASGTLCTGPEVDTLAQPLIQYGLRGLPNYIASHLKYPAEAYRLDIQGKVTIEFVVEVSGSVSNMRTTGYLGGGCDEEAMRLARTLCWTPAVRKGLSVRSIMQLEVQFKLAPSQR